MIQFLYQNTERIVFMFCMRCGQQLPDDANFCFKCGNSTVFDSICTPKSDWEANRDTIVEPVAESEATLDTKSDITPVTDSNVESVAYTLIKPKTNKSIFNKTSLFVKNIWADKKKRYLSLGVLMIIIIAAIIVIVATAKKESVSIPDPEVYFSLSLYEEDKYDSKKYYTYRITDDGDYSDAVLAYVEMLRYDFDFLLTNTENESSFTNYFFIGECDSELEIRYYYGSYSAISFVTSKNIKFEPLATYSGSTTPTLQNSEGCTTSTDSPTVSYNSYTATEATSAPIISSTEFKDREPDYLPDFLVCDTTNTFRHYHSWLTSDDTPLLGISYVSEDPNAKSEVKNYLNVLYEMGYKLDETYSNSEKYYLYHDDIESPTLKYTKGQLEIDAINSSNNEVSYIYIKVPKAIIVEGFENTYDEEVAQEKERQSNNTSSSSASGGSSGGSTASLNKDLYDVKSRCGVCGGDGDCNTCGGDGKLYSSAADKENRNCYSCSGRGHCKSCGGDGWVGEN